MARLTNKGQVALWEVALTLCVISVVYIWYSMHHTAEANTFKDKAQQTQITNSGIRLFDFSCVPKGISDTWGGKNAIGNKVGGHI